MDLLEAKELTIELMTEHGLIASGWLFNWNNRKRAFGVCNHTKKQILLSQALTPSLKVEAVTNTILHEIAHALVGKGHGHDNVWRRKAIEIGCNGQRCSNHPTDIQAKYEAECIGCGYKHKAHRRPKRKAWCRCTNRSFKAELVLNYVQQF